MPGLCLCLEGFEDVGSDLVSRRDAELPLARGNQLVCVVKRLLPLPIVVPTGMAPVVAISENPLCCPHGLDLDVSNGTQYADLTPYLEAYQAYFEALATWRHDVLLNSRYRAAALATSGPSRGSNLLHRHFFRFMARRSVICSRRTASSGHVLLRWTAHLSYRRFAWARCRQSGGLMADIANLPLAHEPYVVLNEWSGNGEEVFIP